MRTSSSLKLVKIDSKIFQKMISLELNSLISEHIERIATIVLLYTMLIMNIRELKKKHNREEHKEINFCSKQPYI